MKIIFFSDIHGNKYAFDSFIDNISSIDMTSCEVVFLGDFIGYYYGANEIITYCRENNITCILGNHDKYFLDVLDKKKGIDEFIKRYGNSYRISLNSITEENIDFLRGLPENIFAQWNEKRMYISHGSPLDNLEGRIYPDTDLSIFKKMVEGINYVVSGHTHHKMKRIFNNTIFLNPGSLGQQRDGKGCSYMILDLEKDTSDFYTVNYRIEDLEQEIDFYDGNNNRLKEVLRRKK